MEVVPSCEVCEVILELQPVEVTSRLSKSACHTRPIRGAIPDLQTADVIPDQPEGLYQTCKQRRSYQTNQRGYTRPANSGGHTRPTRGVIPDLKTAEVIPDQPEGLYQTCKQRRSYQTNQRGYTRPANSGGHTRPSTSGDHYDLSPT
jgi:hypothetical protein